MTKEIKFKINDRTIQEIRKLVGNDDHVLKFVNVARDAVIEKTSREQHYKLVVEGLPGFAADTGIEIYNNLFALAASLMLDLNKWVYEANHSASKAKVYRMGANAGFWAGTIFSLMASDLQARKKISE